MTKPVVAFVCVHNSCRSQMAEAIGDYYAGDKFDFHSAGTELADRINPDAVRLIKQRYDIDMEADGQHPKLIEELPTVDILITMGCNVSCPTLPCKIREDWGLDDPTGKADDEFNRIIDIIEAKVKRLRDEHV
ncbi:arsenate reductase ArsC [Corynebacterium sp. H130]|uniref:arsenate reductase ArsC n=1 Tax=Corynebacterium sp. H130 TaxID=3133444 RepID=UPI0030AF0872